MTSLEKMIGLKFPNKKELKRFNALFGILAKYGFEDIVANSHIQKIIPNTYLKKHPETNQILSFNRFERIRMVLEELGPTYVKLGQIFSNREDLLPSELIKELEKLQDQVPVIENFDVTATIEEELGIVISDYFANIDSEPLAAASIAQVHKAKLRNGKVVILKIQRPDIEETIEADIRIMKQLAKSLHKHSKQVKAFQPMRIVAAFEQSIREELQFTREINNIKRFTKNFEGNTEIYIPKVYEELSNNHIICMEFIDGIKVSEIETLTIQNINSREVAKTGVDLYLKQILEHGFFHADPHPGNILVMPDTGKICFIDFGMMGTIMPNDKDLLEELLLYFMNKNVKKIIIVLEKISIKTSISDYKKLEYELYELIEGIINTAIDDIRMDTVLSRFKNILYKNEIILPHYSYMLMRALVIIEGVGLKLDPKFNITDNLSRYISAFTFNRYHPKRILKKNLARFRDISELIDNFPEDMNTILRKIKEGKLMMVHEHKGIDQFQKNIKKATNRLVFAVIIAALSIGSSLLIIADMPPKLGGVPILGAIGFVLSAIFGFIILVSIIRDREL
ncbi:ubiquinone biosynthesis protein [Aquimarina sp. MAR_2010_214]|uniref:ABC1 kinase family protein n=1 Tax=Aquimarina sp. MAR_2010_214 TaxID=1250026 RepID=UPI000C711AB7|nr:AarF/UbiB family protein [Aquimarina sp. MAR_2010_214]PKV50625.1 ubiquinone biosynthesis protein [Aquimarina sp. MAR_2010_214]